MSAEQAIHLLNAGAALFKAGRMQEAAQSFAAAVAANPDDPAAYNDLGAALQRLDRHGEAVAAFTAALERDPGRKVASYNLGLSLHAQDRHEEAVEAFRRALALDPAFVEASSDLGNALMALGRTNEATPAYQRAVALRPEDPRLHFNLAIALLIAGNLDAGFREFEWRRHIEGFARDVPVPEWTGETLHGETVLLSAEQAFGDVLQFARYAPVVAARGARVVLWAHPPLVRLLRTVPGVADVVSQPDFTGIDRHLPLLSAPHVLGTTLASIPADIPYLRAEEGAGREWRRRLAPLPGLKVGLVWSGDPRPHDPRAARVDRRRSLALGQLSPLADIAGVTFVSLQKGAPAAQAKCPPPGMDLIDWMEEIGDFADTAALVANLDLVISVDTSMVHLAGALGKPVWILSRFDGCWRWLENRDDSPWYPSARLFRQTSPGGWDDVIARVAGGLRRLAAGNVA